MRVYEIAKEKGLSSKDVLDLLEKGGFAVASHMSVVPEDAIEYLENKLSGKTKTPAPARSKKVEIEQREVIKKPSVSQKTPENKVEIAKIKSKPLPKKIMPSRPNRFFRAERQPITQININSPLPLFEVAQIMGKSDGDLIFVLLKKGLPYSRTNVLDIETIVELGAVFGIEVNVTSKEDSADKFLSSSAKGVTRWPIVVVMGHVDHGKTTLLDFLRKKNVAEKEKGGITQHLGAYEVDSNHGKIVFLDTPGHEAFSYLRSRGSKVTDIAVLVIAAEDGIKPQTLEAINHAKESDVPIIVAINKIDKIPEERRDVVLQGIYRQLAEKNLLVEEWGGDVVSVPISAKVGIGVDELLEMIVLQSQMMELKADVNEPARAFVLESNLEKGFGPVATVIPLEGTLKKGDYFVCGNSTGRVRLLINSFGQKVDAVAPSVPVMVIGFDTFAEIGGWLNVVSAQEYKKAKSLKHIVSSASVQSPSSLLSLEKEDRGQINLIIKTDTRGSKEAIEGSIRKLSKLTEKNCARLNIIISALGDVSLNDVEFADTTGALILTLHAKVERKALHLAQEKNINIKNFDVIYHLVEFLEEALKKTKEVKSKWVKVAQLLVKRVFDIKRLGGVIAGCSVQDGTVAMGNKVVCIRSGQGVGEGIIKSLQREKKVVKEVRAGFECGFITDGFQDWKESDIVHVFAQEKVLDSE
jgi:translation initiation factor IF-2